MISKGISYLQKLQSNAKKYSDSPYLYLTKVTNGFSLIYFLMVVSTIFIDLLLVSALSKKFFVNLFMEYKKEKDMFQTITLQRISKVKVFT